MRRAPFRLLVLLLLLAFSVGSSASAADLTLGGPLTFASLDGSPDDDDGAVDGVFTVDGDLIVEGTVECNDGPDLPGPAGACPIALAVSGDLILNAGSGLFAENRKGGGDGGAITLGVGGDLVLRGPAAGLGGAVLSSGVLNAGSGSAGAITAMVGGGIELEPGSAISAASLGRDAGTIELTGGGRIVLAGLVASGPSQELLAGDGSGAVLKGGSAFQAGGPISVRSLSSQAPALQVEGEGVVVSQGQKAGGSLVLFEACGIEVRGLVASVSREQGPSLVALRSGRGISVDGRDLGSGDPLAGRRGQVRADGVQGGAAGYLVDLFAQESIQILGPDPLTGDDFAIRSAPGSKPKREAGGTIRALALAGGIEATGNAFQAGRQGPRNAGGRIDLQALDVVSLDGAVLRAVGGFGDVATGAGGTISARSFQGNLSWTFGTGDVRPQGEITLTACAGIDTTGTDFPGVGAPATADGVCAPPAPVLPAGEPPLPACNAGPVADDVTATTPEDTPVTIALTATDPDGDPLTFSIETPPAHGTLGPLVPISPTQVDVIYTPDADYFGSDGFTFRVDDGNGGTDLGDVQITVESVNDLPVLADDTLDYSTAGNTQLRVAGAAGSAVAFLEDAASVFAKSAPSDVDGPAAPTVVPFSGSTGNGDLVLNTDGSFVYEPHPGFTGTDSIPFQVTDSIDTVAGTLNITVDETVWYVRDVVDAVNPAGGDGRSTDAFETLAAAEAASAEGDVIFVFRGDTGTTPLSGGIRLQSGQRLWGEGFGLSIAPLGTIVPAGDRPRIDDAEAEAVRVLADAGDVLGVEVRGLDLSGATNAIDVTATGAHSAGVTIRGNAVSAAGLEGIDVNANSTGTVTLAIRDTTIAANGTGLDVTRTAGTVVVTALDGLAVSGDTGGSGIVITGPATFDAVPGGALDPVTGGMIAIGASGNPVGGAGFVATGVTGALDFTDLDVFAGGGAGLRVSGTGAFTGAIGTRVTVGAGVGIVETTGGPAVDLSSLTADVQLASLRSVNSSTTGVSLSGTGGTFSAGSGSSITGAAGVAFDVSGGSPAVIYGGTITNAANRSVSLTGRTGGAATFSGAITDTGAGVFLDANAAGSSASFTGGLSLTTETNPAFTATNGGTVTVTGTNTVSTTTGAGVNIANATIGAGGVTFRSVSVNGAANGIVLNNTGALGGLTVTGTGGAGSGGTIQNATGPGILLTSTRNVNLSFMNIQGGGDDGIRGTNVTGFTLAGTTVSSNGNGVGESGLDFNGLFGTASVSSSTVTGSHEDNLVVRNGSGVLTLLSVTNSTFSNNSTTDGNDGILFEASSTANMSISVTGSSFSAHKGDHFQAAALNSGVLDVAFTGNTLSGGHASPLGQGITISAATGVPGYAGTVTYDVSNNAINGAISYAINANLGTSAAGASFGGTISNNVIGTSGSSLSCSSQASGINVEAHGNGTHTVAVTGNTIRQCFDRGINVLANDGGGTLNMTVTGNTVAELVAAFSREGFFLNAGSTSTNVFGAVDSHFVCLKLGGAGAEANTLNNGPGTTDDFRLRQRFNTTIRLPGYGGAAGDTAAVVAFVSGNNPGATGSATVNFPAGGGGFVGGAACPLP